MGAYLKVCEVIVKYDSDSTIRCDCGGKNIFLCNYSLLLLSAIAL